MIFNNKILTMILALTLTTTLIVPTELFANQKSVVIENPKEVLPKGIIPEEHLIIGYKGSTAEEYAKTYGNLFQDINLVNAPATVSIANSGPLTKEEYRKIIKGGVVNKRFTYSSAGRIDLEIKNSNNPGKILFMYEATPFAYDKFVLGKHTDLMLNGGTRVELPSTAGYFELYPNFIWGDVQIKSFGFLAKMYYGSNTPNEDAWGQRAGNIEASMFIEDGIAGNTPPKIKVLDVNERHNNGEGIKLVLEIQDTYYDIVEVTSTIGGVKKTETIYTGYVPNQVELEFDKNEMKDFNNEKIIATAFDGVADPVVAEWGETITVDRTPPKLNLDIK